ncbi:MAG: STAS domain-containing protein [Kiritimatiellae bacterium]|nr:STAS domain-containing protein [Kiritimatiellia bacterium]
MNTPPAPPSAPAPAPARVWAATLDGMTLVAVSGTANFKLAPAFKQALKAAALAESPTVVVDMAECLHLDSTFMGAIASAALASRKPGARPVVRFLNIRPNVSQLLKGLGILPLLDVLPEGFADLSPLVANLAPVETAPLAEQSMTAILYDAHDTLAGLSPENQARFRDLLELLRADLNRPQ